MLKFHVPHPHLSQESKKEARIVLVKTITWRLLASIPLLFITFFITNDITALIAVAGIDTLSRTLLYIVHEFVWYRFTQ